MVKFPHKCVCVCVCVCVWQNRFNPDSEVGLALYTDGSKTNKGAGSGV